MTPEDLYDEFKELDERYRAMAEKLKGTLTTTENMDDEKKLLELGRSVEAKLRELNDSIGIRITRV